MKSRSRTSVVVVGELCMDAFVSEQRVVLGGWAHNVALQLHSAGARASVISAVGTDELADMFFAEFKDADINADHVKVIPGETSHVDIVVDDSGQPIYLGGQLGVLAALHIDSTSEGFIREQDAASAVRYQPIAHLFDEFCALDLPNTLKIGDFAGISTHTGDANVVEEFAPRLDVIVKSLQGSDIEGIEFLHRIAVNYNKLVLVLLGSAGSMAFQGNNTFRQETVPLDARNTTGAGDAYLAHFIVEYLGSKSIQRSIERGNTAATRHILQQNQM
jgi:fructoselysine 6-kinase